MTLSEKQGYDAMRAFLTAYWERSGNKDDDIAQLLRWTEIEPDGQPFDPAMWEDWIEAVRKTTSQ